MENKVVIITGAANGIGKAVGNKCASEGMNVVIADIDMKSAIKTAEEIKKKYKVKALAIEVDVSNEEEVKLMVQKTLEEFGDIYALVNNAGIIRLGNDFENVNNEEWHSILNVNLMGVVNCCREVLPILKENKKGKIVNMSSLSAYTGGMAVSPTYAASKAAIQSVTRTIAKQVAHLKINVNSVAPGLIDTDLTELCGYDPEQVPLKELGTPENVADGVFFLISNSSSHITGITLDITGGMHVS